MTDYSADVLVIGSGAGGGMAAAHLVNNGLTVLLLERGDWYHPENFPTRHADWEARGSAFSDSEFSAPRSDPTLVYRNGASIPPSNKAYGSARGPGASSNFKRRNPFIYHRVHGVGGSTLHYEGEAHRFAPHGFRPKSHSDYGVDWPLNYENLARWYQLAETSLGVAGDPNNPFKAAREMYPTPPHPLSAKGLWAGKGAERLGWQLLPNSLALPSLAWGSSPGCQHSGVCSRGCPFGAKSSVDRALLQPALATGRLEVLTSARVVEIETGANGNVRQVVFSREGTLLSASARSYILSAGAIESPRLLLASRSGRYPEGIGNVDDQVGRYLMETVYVAYLIKTGQPLEAWKGPPLEGRIWDFSAPGRNSGLNGFTMAVSDASDFYTGPRSYALLTKGVGRAHKAALRVRFGSELTLYAVADHEPSADNRISLVREQDDFGVPRVRVESDYSQRDLATIGVARDRLEQLAEACEAESIGRFYSTYTNPSTTHIGGTCRMGTDRADSVTDSFGRVWGVDNLRVLDGSILPGQGMGDSPSLTIQALALRSAEQLARSGSSG